jgi:hypothetical protein
LYSFSPERQIWSLFLSAVVILPVHDK